MKTNQQSKVVILTDLGNTRAFRVFPKRTVSDPHQGPASVKEFSIPMEEVYTDQQGAFPIGNDSNESTVMSQGENHQKKNEHEKKRIHFIAQKIEEIISKEENKAWCLAAPETINKRLLERIPLEMQKSLLTNIKADLTHITLKELEQRFM